MENIFKILHSSHECFSTNMFAPVFWPSITNLFEILKIIMKKLVYNTISSLYSPQHIRSSMNRIPIPTFMPFAISTSSHS